MGRVVREFLLFRSVSSPFPARRCNGGQTFREVWPLPFSAPRPMAANQLVTLDVSGRLARIQRPTLIAWSAPGAKAGNA